MKFAPSPAKSVLMHEERNGEEKSVFHKGLIFSFNKGSEAVKRRRSGLHS